MNNFIPEFNRSIEVSTADFRNRTASIIPYSEYAFFAPYVSEINRLKKEKNAVILAHNYMSPDIFYGVADIMGDSLSLAVEANKVDADIIVQCGVHFMAETSKILNPFKKVLLPDLNAGCSLASSITGSDVQFLKQKYPGVPVVSYVNTSADVKAETDICCTSSNALQVVQSLDTDTVIFIPDKFLAQNIAQQTNKKIITWDGSCMVHEIFSVADINGYKQKNAETLILAHPECTPDVVAVADYTGSTAGLSNFVKEKKPESVMLITECSMADNIMLENPEVNFVKPCHFCPHMKRISLPKILECLQTEQPEIILDDHIIERARGSVERMIKFNEKS